MFFFENLLSYVIPVCAAVVILFILLSFWRRVPADKAMVITGLKKRVLSGKGGFIIPFLETACTISLENISITTDVNDAPSKQGIFVNIVGTAVIKVRNEADAIATAVEQFCSGGDQNTVNVIKNITEQMLEGKLRGIISTLTVEQINEDRASLEQRIEEDISRGLQMMGLQLVSYSILKITTQGGYLENKSRPQIAQSKADADIAEAEKRRDTEIKTAEAAREGQKARLEAETAIAEAERDKTIKTEQYRAERDKAKADADVAYRLQEIENQSVVAEREAQLAEKNAIVVEKKLIAEVKKPAEARKYETEVNAEAEKVKSIKEAEAEAEAIKIKAAAEAEAIRIKAQAEAEAIEAKGLAEAKTKEKVAEAMSKYGQAAVVDLVVSRLPEIMREVAKPIEQVEKITIIDNGGGQGGSKVSKIVTDVAANGFQLLKDLTGVDLAEIMNEKLSNKEQPNTPVEIAHAASKEEPKTADENDKELFKLRQETVSKLNDVLTQKKNRR